MFNTPTSWKSRLAVIPGAVWQYIEVYGVIDPAVGEVTVRVNETVVLAITSTNTSAGGSPGVDQINFGNNNVIDDFYICDNSGASLNNFLGNTRVPAQLPNGAGSSTEWTPTGSASFNWQLASNPYMDDSSYVSCGTPGDIDLYTLSPVANAPLIMAVQSIVVARRAAGHIGRIIHVGIAGQLPVERGGTGRRPFS